MEKSDKIRHIHQAYRIIKPDHEAIHDHLLAWARWCKIKWHPQAVKSLEGRYRPPPMYEPAAPSTPPDLLLCYAIERLIASAPNQFGQHLRMWYIRRYPMEAAARKLGMPYSQVEPHLTRARQFVLVHLKR